MFMHGKSTNEIIEFYNNLLPLLKHGRQRHAKVKTKLSQLVKPDMTILDMGCGTGIISKFMAQLGGKVTAVDIAPKLIEYAKKESKHKNIKYICQDVTTLDLKKTFDLIVIVDCLEHIDCLEDVIYRIDIHSNKDTVIFINIPDERFQRYMKCYHKDKLQIIDNAYGIDDLIALDSRDSYNFWFTDFELIEIEIYGIDVPCQYNNYTFIHRDKLDFMYKEGLAKMGMK